jgi:hypothetical protein
LIGDHSVDHLVCKRVVTNHIGLQEPADAAISLCRRQGKRRHRKQLAVLARLFDK